MPRAKPKVERQCLVCDSTFLGTPAATRCPTCKDTGLKVPQHRQRARRRGETRTAEELLAETEARKVSAALNAALNAAAKASAALDRELHLKTCGACGEQFTATRSNAARCAPCIAEDRPVKRRDCLECGEPFVVLDDSHVNCPVCADLLQITQDVVTPEQAERLAEEDRRNRIKERIAMQTEWLARREAKPRGYKAMTAATARTPIGVTWLEICAHDGAASAALYANTDLTEDEKVTLLTSYFRLRAKRYHPDAIAKLCPSALLRDEAQGALGDLPEVSADCEEDDDWLPDLIEGDTCLAREIAEITERQDRRRAQIALGLAS